MFFKGLNYGMLVISTWKQVLAIARLPAISAGEGMNVMMIKTLAVAAAFGLASATVAAAGTYSDSQFTITATNAQLSASYPGASTFASSSTFAGYSGSVATPVATISGGALNAGGSTNPDTGIDNSISNYVSALSGIDETISFNSNQSHFGFLWGSVDATNTVSFYENTTLVASYTGAALEANSAGLQAYAAPGSFVDFVANAPSSNFNKVVFSASESLPFETSNLAVSAAPEPGLWALMIAGLAMMGGALRLRRRQTGFVAA